MKKITIHALALAALSAPVCGCIKDATPYAGLGKQVKFETAISSTRARGNLWEAGDMIGVYMLPSNATDWVDPAPLAENARYGHGLESGTAPGVTFTGVGDEVIRWPAGDGYVDFVAYYPYRETITGFIYPVNVSDQTSQGDIDLLYSDNATEKNSSSGNPALSFEHMLSKLIFNVEDTEGADLEGMSVSIGGLKTTARFDLTTGEMVSGSEGGAVSFDASVISTSDEDDDPEQTEECALVEAIVLPGDDLSFTLTFVLDNGDVAVFTETDVDFESGRRYTYNISLTPHFEGGARIGFGADGGLSTIKEWIGENDKDGEAPKASDGTPAAGERWHSGILVGSSSLYSVASTGTVEYQEAEGYEISGTGGAEEAGKVTVVMNGYPGEIGSVTVTMKRGVTPHSAEISSVKVGGTSLLYNGSENSVVVTANDDYLFEAPDGTPLTGAVSIVVDGKASGSVFFESFTVN
jgi:hypothetical protein